MSATTTPQQQKKRRGRGKPWAPGQSGNPAGRPFGARHKATMAAEALLDGEAETLTRRAIEKAKEGDSIALRLVLERIIPPRRERPIRIDLPALTSAADLTAAFAAVASAVAQGEITAGEGADVSSVLNAFMRAHELLEIEARLRKLEECRNGEVGT